MATKVLILEDNPVIQKFYQKALQSLEDVEIVGAVFNGKEGLEVLAQTEPDVILCDLNMPVMDGFEFTEKAMALKPKPILIVSDLVQLDDSENRFRALDLGAVDVLPKPRAGGSLEALARDLERKIRVLRGVVALPRLGRNRAGAANFPAAAGATPTAATPAASGASEASGARALNWSRQTPARFVAIGASTGGPQTLQAIFQKLPKGFPAPVVCAQHISPGFTQSLVAWLASSAALQVKIAAHGERPQPGVAYFAPDGKNLGFAHGALQIADEREELRFAPSANFLFEAFAHEAGSQTVGVLLTGMGDDGARGLKALRDAGGWTIAEDESTAIVYGMPRAARELDAACEVLPAHGVAARLLALAEAQS